MILVHLILQTQDHLGILRDLDAGHDGDIQSAFPDDAGIYTIRSGPLHNGFQLFLFFTGDKIAALTFKLADYLIADTVFGNDTLLGSADRSVVECAQRLPTTFAINIGSSSVCQIDPAAFSRIFCKRSDDLIFGNTQNFTACGTQLFDIPFGDQLSWNRLGTGWHRRSRKGYCRDRT